jgi:uncharacterized protein YjlB
MQVEYTSRTRIDTKHKKRGIRGAWSSALRTLHHFFSDRTKYALGLFV